MLGISRTNFLTTEDWKRETLSVNEDLELPRVFLME